MQTPMSLLEWELRRKWSATICFGFENGSDLKNEEFYLFTVVSQVIFKNEILLIKL